MNKTISVIIVTYYTGSSLWRVIESALVQEYLHEIIIINNGNPHRVSDGLSKLTSKYNIKLFNPGNIGFAAGCNMGASAASGKYLVFLNPDCLIKTSNAFRLFVDFFELNKDATLINCKILNSNYSIQKTCVRNQLNLKILFAEGFLLYKIPYIKKFIPRINVNVDDVFNPIEVDAISGALMAISKNDYTNYGGIDEGYFLHMEDLDFCRRIKEEGGKIYYIPNIEVMHYLSTSEASANIVELHKMKGFIRYFSKFYGKLIIFIIAPLLFFRYVLGCFKNFLSKLKFKYIYNELTKNDQKLVCDLFNFNFEIKQNREITVASLNQIGIATAKNLLAKGYKINILYRTNSLDFYNEQINWIQCDYSKNIELDLKKLNNCPILIHTASIIHLPKIIEQWPDSKLGRIICFSSTSIFTKSKSKNIVERTNIESLQTAEKKVIEICQKKNINYTILRPTMIYGLRNDKNVNLISNFITRFKFFPAYGDLRGLRQPVCVFDLANAACDIIDNEKTYNKCYNLAGGEELSYKDMILRIFANVNIKPRFFKINFLIYVVGYIEKFIKFPISKSMFERVNHDMIFDNSKANQDFNYKPRKFLK